MSTTGIWRMAVSLSTSSVSAYSKASNALGRHEQRWGGARTARCRAAPPERATRWSGGDFRAVGLLRVPRVHGVKRAAATLADPVMDAGREAQKPMLLLVWLRGITWFHATGEMVRGPFAVDDVPFHSWVIVVP